MSEQFPDNTLRKRSLTLYSVPWPGTRNQAALSVDIYGNNPRFKIWLNKSEEENTNLANLPGYVKMSLLDMSVILDIIQCFGLSGTLKDDVKFKFFTKKQDERVVQSMLKFEVNEKGVLLLVIALPERGTMKFPITCSGWTELMGVDNPEGAASKLYSKSWARNVQTMLDYELTASHVDEKKLSEDLKAYRLARDREKNEAKAAEGLSSEMVL